MILHDNVVQIFDPDHIDRDRATEGQKHAIDSVDPGRVGAAAITDDLAPQSVHLQARAKYLVAADLLRCFDSMKSNVLPNLSTAL